MEKAAENFTQTESVRNLHKVYEDKVKNTHLKELLADDTRNNEMLLEAENIVLDYTHTKITKETME